ncbi:MAG: transglycosylase SLT domain-containing protein [Paracoccaceae bacterium]
MNRTGLLLLLFLSACGASVEPPPSDLNDACVIKAERPKWMKALQTASAKWQVPIPVMMATVYQESKFDGLARTPLAFRMGVIPMGRDSSAYGYAQAIDSTWKWYQRETGNRSAKREDFADAVDFMGWYMDQSNQRLGISKSNARRQYLAYHDGHVGYRRGTYRRKRWLLRVSKEVQARARMYAEQLDGCAEK